MQRFTSIATLYAAWFFTRALLHRGWWLVTSLYLVVEAALSPFELIFLGTAQGLTILIAELPTGVFADTYSRKWSLVIAHALMGMAMISTAMVLSFPALVVTQMVWGLAWTFSSGADVAWMTDELDDPKQTPQALITAAKWGECGAAAGIVALGVLAWSTSLATAMVCAGIGMLVLGGAVAYFFRETKFQPAAKGNNLKHAAHTLRTGMARLRGQRILLHILTCTLLINGADEAFGRLYAKQLVDLGLPDSAAPIFSLTLLALVTLACSVAALNATHAYLSNGTHYARIYGMAALCGALGLAVFAGSPNVYMAAIGVLMVTGLATSVLRTVSVVWANEHASSEIRATLQSFLSLAENIGEITLGFALALVASYAGIPVALMGSCIIFAAVVVAVERRAQAL